MVSPCVISSVKERIRLLKKYLFRRTVNWLIFKLVFCCLVALFTPSQASPIARNTFTDTVKHWNKPFRDILTVKLFAVLRKWTRTKPIYCTVDSDPVPHTSPSISAGTKISCHSRSAPSHFSSTFLP